MERKEISVEELLGELKVLIDELKIAVGRVEKNVLGARVRRVDYYQVATILPAIERLLERFYKSENKDSEWSMLIASYDPESRKILEVYAPKKEQAK